MTHRVELVAQELGLSATRLWQFDDAAIAARRSGRLVSNPLDPSTLATLLAAASSVPPMIPDATFAPVIYPIIFAIEGITGGAYRYAHNEHALVPIRDVDRQTVADTAIL